MDEEKKPKTIEVKLSLPDSGGSEPIAFGYYKETLNFLGKISLPAALIVSILLFKSEIANILPNIKSASFFGVSITLNKEEKKLAEAIVQNNEKEAVKLAKAIPDEKIQELVDIRGQSLERSTLLPTSVKLEANVKKEDLPKEIIQTPKPSWQVAMDISWVKPNDLFGNIYFIEIDKGIYLWPTKLDQQSGFANILINTSTEGRNKGKLLEAATIKEGEEFLFTHNAYEYSLKLVDIRKAGVIKTLAGYFYAQKRKL